MFAVPDDNADSFFVSGTYRGVGSIMKFYKRNAALRWHAQLDKMTRVDAIAVRQPAVGGHFFGCGQNNSDDRGLSSTERYRISEAWLFSMDSDGEARWIMRLAGSSLSSTSLVDSC